MAHPRSPTYGGSSKNEGLLNGNNAVCEYEYQKANTARACQIRKYLNQ